MFFPVQNNFSIERWEKLAFVTFKVTFVTVKIFSFCYCFENNDFPEYLMFLMYHYLDLYNA